MEHLINILNHQDKNIRLEALMELAQMIRNGTIAPPAKGNDVNNHIHTIYSFSPYSPAKAVWMAYMAGLTTAGIMDHDSISGAEEFIKAGEIIGLATTIGVEFRVDVSKTALCGRKTNNPDQESIAYIAIHGIPHTQISKVMEFFKYYSVQRNIRNRKMTTRLNELLNPYDILLDFDTDIVSLSMMNEGGSITERHILFAVSKKMIHKLGKGRAIVDFLTEILKINLSDNIGALLCDQKNPYYEYDLLGALKSDMVGSFYIPATGECPDINDIVSFSKDIGGIMAYSYLGDVSNSVTGDKKAQKFEDDYLDLLFETLKVLGVNAITYMPSRNTMEQLKRIRMYCNQYGFFQISGEDINSPRQSFVCVAQRAPEFKNLIDSTWALIGHEKASTIDLKNGFFSRETKQKLPNLNERIQVYKRIGKREFDL
jgi:hypothetical protein